MKLHVNFRQKSNNSLCVHVVFPLEIYQNANSIEKKGSAVFSMLVIQVKFYLKISLVGPVLLTSLLNVLI